MFFYNIFVLIFGQMAVGVFYGFYWPSIEAYTSEKSSQNDHQKRINQFCIAWSAGYMLGPVVAPLLKDIHPAISFIVMIGFCIINLIVAITKLPKNEQVRTNNGIKDHGNTEIIQAPLDKSKSWTILILICLIFTYAFTKGFFIGLFPDIAENDMFWNWPSIQTSIVFLFFGLSRTITFVFQNNIKGKRTTQAILVSTILSVSCFLFTISNDFVFLSIIFTIFGIFSGLTYTMTLQRLMEVTSEGKGQAAGFFESAIGIGTFIAPIVGGAVLSITGSEIATFFMIGTISTLVSLVATITYKRSAIRRKI